MNIKVLPSSYDYSDFESYDYDPLLYISETSKSVRTPQNTFHFQIQTYVKIQTNLHTVEQYPQILGMRISIWCQNEELLSLLIK